MHVAPAEYDNPDAEWLLNPGDEKTECYHLKTPNDIGRYYIKQQYRMRPGSHHMIITSSDDTTSPEGWGPCKSSIVGSGAYATSRTRSTHDGQHARRNERGLQRRDVQISSAPSRASASPASR